MPRGRGYSQASEPKKSCLPNVSFCVSRCSLCRTALWADKHVPIRLGTAPSGKACPYGDNGDAPCDAAPSVKARSGGTRLPRLGADASRARRHVGTTHGDGSCTRCCPRKTAATCRCQLNSVRSPRWRWPQTGSRPLWHSDEIDRPPGADARISWGALR